MKNRVEKSSETNYHMRTTVAPRYEDRVNHNRLVEEFLNQGGVVKRVETPLERENTTKVNFSERTRKYPQPVSTWV